MNNYYKNDDLDSFLNLKVLQIPENAEFIKIDVGLAGEAPNSAIWLSETQNRYVIGVEPLRHHWNMLFDFENSGTTREYPYDFKILQLIDESVRFQKRHLCSIKDRFLGLECAIDNVDGVSNSLFYEMDRHLGQSGASSLLPPSNVHPAKLNQVLNVKTISLEKILEKIPWDRFGFIEHLKTDCEGKDFDVVKSCGKFLEKIVYITSEMTNNTHHVIGACDPNQFIRFMISNDFEILSHIGGNINFINKRLKHLVEKFKLKNNILGQ